MRSSMQRVRQLIKPLAYQLVSLVFRQKSQLTPEYMLAQYKKGYFPMATNLGKLTWHNPEIRAIMPLDERFHVSKNLAKRVRNNHFQVTFNQVFPQIIAACAAPAPGREVTWLSADLQAAYLRLHQLGHAISVEVWQQNQLVGGGYGVVIGKFFSGESMFSHVDDAGKVALVHQVEYLRKHGFLLCDVQAPSNFSRPFGVIEIPREEYQALFVQAIQ